MPKARRAPIWVVWSRRIGCCRMACDNLWCRMNAERRSPAPVRLSLSGQKSARRQNGSSDRPTNEMWQASEQGAFISLFLSLAQTRPLSPSHYHYHPQQREGYSISPRFLADSWAAQSRNKSGQSDEKAGETSASTVWSGQDRQDLSSHPSSQMRRVIVSSKGRKVNTWN